MKQKLKRALPFFGYTSWFFASLFLFSYLTFPYEKLRDYIINNLEYEKDASGRLTPTGYHVSIVDLAPYWFSGIEVTGLRVITQPTDPSTTATDTSFPSLTARVSLLSLLIGSIKTNYEIEVPGGSIDGDFSTNFDQTEIETHTAFHEVNLRALPILREYAALPMKGFVNGRIELNLPQTRDSASGFIELTIRKFELGDGVTKMPIQGLPGGLSVEPIHAGNTQLRIDIAQSEGTVRRLSAQGPDVEMSGSGSVHLTQPISTSRLDLLIRARFTDTYKNQSERTRTMFSLLEMNPVLRRARTPDNWLQVRIRGSAATRIVPTPAGDERPGQPGRPRNQRTRPRR